MDTYTALLNGEQIEQEPDNTQYILNEGYAHYRTTHYIPSRDVENSPAIQIAGMNAYTRARTLMDLRDIASEYTQFQIPKRSGGFRTIHAPSDALKEAQRAVVLALTYELHMHPHEAAHAYVAGRSPKTSLEVHQANKSKWFLKLDIKDFFPSCSKRFVHYQLGRLFPLCFLKDNIIKLMTEQCFLNDALPQGAVSSPLLSNLVMIPIDFAMRKISDEFHQRFVYTRYADDILISSEYAFDFRAVEKYVADVILADSPFEIKHEKTRYGSAAGQNWNLGLMLNKDNGITVGHKRKTTFKHSVFNLLTDFKNGVAWSAEDKLSLGGMRSYIQSVEPAYVQGVISYYENKVGVLWKDAIKIL